MYFTFESFPRRFQKVSLESREILNQLGRFLRGLIWPGIKYGKSANLLWETLLKTFDDPWCGIHTKVYGCVWRAGGRGGGPSTEFIKS